VLEESSPGTNVNSAYYHVIFIKLYETIDKYLVIQ